jgi:hypothetical protein
MAQEDKSGGDLTAAFDHWYAITPSDTVDLEVMPRAIHVGGTGDLNVMDRDGKIATIHAAAVGYHNLRPKRVLSNGTAATYLTALY